MCNEENISSFQPDSVTEKVSTIIPITRMLLSCSTPSILDSNWFTTVSWTPVLPAMLPLCLQIASISSKMMICTPLFAPSYWREKHVRNATCHHWKQSKQNSNSQQAQPHRHRTLIPPSVLSITCYVCTRPLSRVTSCHPPKRGGWWALPKHRTSQLTLLREAAFQGRGLDWTRKAQAQSWNTQLRQRVIVVSM